MHSVEKKKELIPKIELKLIQFKTTEEKEEALVKFIMDRANDSLNQFDRFKPMVKRICEKYDGYRFKAGVKIKNRNQTKALVRIK